MSKSSSVSDEQLSRYIGDIARHWSAHEHLMAALYQTVLRVSYNQAVTIFFALSPPQRRDLLSALAQPEIQDEALKADLQSYLQKFDAAKKLRNDAVHGLWSSVPAFDTPLLTLVKSRASARMNFDRPKRAWFENIIRLLRELDDTAVDINERLFAEIASHKRRK